MCVLNQTGNLGSSALTYLGSLDKWLLEKKTSMLKNLVAGGMQFLKCGLQPSAVTQVNKYGWIFSPVLASWCLFS